MVDGKPRDCCLGVLCDLYRIDTGKGEWLLDGDFTLGEDANDDYDTSPITYEEDLPRVVCMWAGLSESNPELGGVMASSHNDGEPYLKPPVPAKSFTEIAELIEANL